MRELDFDILAGQDAGRALYRTFFLFGCFQGFRTVYTQMNPHAQKWMTFVEKELWRSSRCFVQMRPRFRLAYCAILCSYLPYGVRLAYEHLSDK